MPRYEFSDGSSNKFWQIELEGSSFTTTYGRIGTDGQSSMKEYDSEALAKKEHDKLVAEKVKKGYHVVDGSAPTAAAAPPAPAAAPPPAPAPAKKEAPPAAKSGKKAVFDDEGDEEEEAPKPKTAAPAAAAPAPAAAASRPAVASGASKSGDAGARYFEFVDGSSSKFWEIQLEGTSFTTRYGKIGTDGQSSMKEFDSDAKAKAQYDKLVAEKTGKGYLEK
jgi:predicted DNA-binding WGR domain protein